MAQKNTLSLIALQTVPERTFLAKVAVTPLEPASALHGDLTIAAVLSGTLNVTPAFTAELRVTNVST